VDRLMAGAKAHGVEHRQVSVVLQKSKKKHRGA
jgi:hypothetical protein